MGKGPSAPTPPPKAAPPTKVVEVKSPEVAVIGKKKKKKGFADTVLSEGSGLGAPAAQGGSAGGSTVLGNAS